MKIVFLVCFFPMVASGQIADSLNLKEVSVQSLQLKANSLSPSQQKQLEQRFEAKFTGDISGDQYGKELNALFSNNDRGTYLVSKGVHTTLSAFAESGIDVLVPGKKLKQIFIKKIAQKTSKGVADFFDPSKAEEEKRLEKKQQVIDLTTKWFNYEKNQPNTSFDDVQGIKNSFKSSEAGQWMMKKYGSEIFETAYNNFVSDQLPNAVVTKAEFQSASARIKQEQAELDNRIKEQKNATAAIVTHIVKAHESNAIAASRIQQRIMQGNNEISELKQEVNGLAKQNINTQKQLQKIHNIAMRTSLDLNALKVATEQNTAEIVRIGNDVVELKGTVFEINNKVDRLSQDIVEIKLKSEWDDMPLDAQLKALRETEKFDGLFQDKAMKSKVIQEYEAIAFKQKTINTLNNVSAYGSVALNAMEKFRVGDDNLKRNLAYAIEASSIAANAYSGNYAQALNGALNLFGGSGSKSDPQQEMLQQIMMQIEEMRRDMMEQFNLVHNSLNAIYGDMHTWFDSLNRQIIHINTRLDQMKEDNDRHFAFVAGKLNYIQNQNSCTQEMISEHFSFYEKCFSSYAVDFTHPDSYKSDMYIKFREGHADCIRAFQAGISNNLESSTLLDHTDCNTGVKMILLYGKLLSSWKASQTRLGAMADERMDYLLHAPKDLATADSFYYSLNEYRDSIRTSNPFFRTFSFTDALTVKYKNPGKVALLASYYLHFLPYLEIYNSGDGTLEDSSKTVSETKLSRLKATLQQLINISEVAIAQNLFLHGNHLTNKVQDIILNENRDEYVKVIFELIRSNPYFEKNLSVYLTGRYFPVNNSLDSLRKWAKANPNRYRMVSDAADWLMVYSDFDGNAFFEIQSVKPLITTTDGVETIKREIVQLPVTTDEYELSLTDFNVDEKTLNLMRIRKLLMDQLSQYNRFINLPESSDRTLDKLDLLYLLSQK